MKQKEPKRVSLDIESEHYLDVAIGTRLLIDFEGLSGKLKSVLLGVDPGKYLIMRIPITAGIRRILYDNNRVVVRFECFGTIYGFRSHVLAYLIKGPIQVVFVSYPKFIEILEMRGSQRINCFLPSKIKISEGLVDSGLTDGEISGSKEFQGIIQDISCEGCRYSTDVSFTNRIPKISIGYNVTLNFELPGESGTQSISGCVRNVYKDSEKIDLGIEFDKSDTETLGKIKNYIAQILKFDFFKKV